MFVLIMIVLLNGSINVNHLYYDESITCSKAALEFEKHATKDMKMRAFCIKGDQ